MSVLCHRCGASLDAPDLFCPNCGAPQVRFEPQEEGEGAYSGTRPIRVLLPSQAISWRDAIHAALIVAIPAGVLSAISVLSWGWCLWVVGGAMLSVALYRKRAPGYLLDTRSGVRIGALSGLIAAYTSVTTTAVWRIFARFVLHQGRAIDDLYDKAIQQATTLVQSNPEAQADWRSYTHFLLSPDGRAAFTLMTAVTTSLGIILFSAIGGALGVRFFAPRKSGLNNPR
jgi:hypothetical protein